MSYVPESWQLNGLSLEKAECYGKPHFQAEYYHEDVRAYRRIEDAVCMICGQRATNAHHHPPKGTASSWTMKTPVGQFVLLPSLFALCGSGTTGCHGDVHKKLIRIRWVWETDENAEDWWSGKLLSHGIKPHSSQLLELGHWEVER